MYIVNVSYNNGFLVWKFSNDVTVFSELEDEDTNNITNIKYINGVIYVNGKPYHVNNVQWNYPYENKILFAQCIFHEGMGIDFNFYTSLSSDAINDIEVFPNNLVTIRTDNTVFTGLSNETFEVTKSNGVYTINGFTLDANTGDIDYLPAEINDAVFSIEDNSIQVSFGNSYINFESKPYRHAHNTQRTSNAYIFIALAVALLLAIVVVIAVYYLTKDKWFSIFIAVCVFFLLLKWM